MAIATAVDRPDLRSPTWKPDVTPALADPEGDMFAIIRAGDVLVHHPYESFDPSGGAVHSAGSQRPQNGGDQDDALPHQRRFAFCDGFGPSGGGGQAGGGAGGIEGPL